MSDAQAAVSRFPVPQIAELPEDIRGRILAVQEKSGFVPNVFLVLAHRPDEFRAFDRKVSAYFGTDIQALALAWVKPFAVACNSITAALGLGFDGELCERSCEPPLRFSPYFNSASARPYTDLGLRLSMLLAADDVAGAKAMIERGVASDHTLGLRGAPPVNAWFVITPDRARSSSASGRRPPSNRATGRRSTASSATCPPHRSPRPPPPGSPAPRAGRPRQRLRRCDGDDSGDTRSWRK